MSHHPVNSPAASVEESLEEPEPVTTSQNLQSGITAMSSVAYLDDIQLDDNDELNYDEEEEELEGDAGMKAFGETESRMPSTEEEGESLNGAEGGQTAPEKISAVSDSEGEEGEISDDEGEANSQKATPNTDSLSRNSTHLAHLLPEKAHRPSEDLEDGELESDSDDEIPVVRDALAVGSKSPTAINEMDPKTQSRRVIRPPDSADGAVGGDGAFGREQVAIVCKFHIRGECQYGDGCRYYHPPEPERSRLRAKYQQRALLIGGGGGGGTGYSTLTGQRSSRQLSIPSLLNCPTAPLLAPAVGTMPMRSAPVVAVSTEASAWARGLKQARAIVNKRAGKSTDETEESGEGKPNVAPAAGTTLDSNGRRLPSLIDGLGSRVTGKRRASSRSPSRSPLPSGGRLRSRVAEVIRSEPIRDERRREREDHGGWRRRELPARTHRTREASLPKAEQISDDSPSPDRGGAPAPAKTLRSPSPKRRRRSRSRSPQSYTNFGRGRRRDIEMSPIRGHTHRSSRDRREQEMSPIRRRGLLTAGAGGGENRPSVSPERHHCRHGREPSPVDTSLQSLLHHQRGSSGEERASRRGMRSGGRAGLSPENKKRIYDWEEDAPAAYSTITDAHKKGEIESGSSSLQALRERLRRKRRRRRSDSSASHSSHSALSTTSSTSGDSTKKKRHRRGSGRDGTATGKGKSPAVTKAPKAEPVSSAEEDGAKLGKVKNPPKTPPTPSGDDGNGGLENDSDNERQPPLPPPIEQSPPPPPPPKPESSSKRRSKEEMLRELKEVKEQIKIKSKKKKQKSGGSKNDVVT